MEKRDLTKVKTVAHVEDLAEMMLACNEATEKLKVSHEILLQKALEQMFNPFFTEKKNGIGLGLSIVSKIVENHNGCVRAHNLPDGTRAQFSIFLPTE